MSDGLPFTRPHQHDQRKKGKGSKELGDVDFSYGCLKRQVMLPIVPSPPPHLSKRLGLGMVGLMPSSLPELPAEGGR
jgi:hypothetical protein